MVELYRLASELKLRTSAAPRRTRGGALPMPDSAAAAWAHHLCPAGAPKKCPATKKISLLRANDHDLYQPIRKTLIQRRIEHKCPLYSGSKARVGKNPYDPDSATSAFLA